MLKDKNYIKISTKGYEYISIW